MASDDDRIRLPELPIFKKYSLALRQEFASPKDLLAALERSATKVEQEVEKANSRRRKKVAAETPPEAPEHDSAHETPAEAPEHDSAHETPPEAPEHDSAHETPPEAAIDELAPLEEQARQPFDFEATSVFDEIDEAMDADAIDAPIWEPEPAPPKPGRQSQIARPAPERKRSAVARPKRKRRASRIEIVPVSSQGKPLATNKNSRARSAAKRKSVTSRKKSSGRRKG